MDRIAVQLLTEHGPWVFLVFYLLYRDFEKDRVSRTLIDKNTAILTELNLIIRERLPGA